MFFNRRRPDLITACLTGIRNDLSQMGASADICNEISSIRQRHQFEALSHNRHLARDVGLIR